MPKKKQMSPIELLEIVDRAACVCKVKDGLVVIWKTQIIDFLDWHEGITWRLTKRLPMRIQNAIEFLDHG